MSSRKVQVYASPGWEVEVDPEWAEGLFAVFLRNAKKKGKAKPKPRARPKTRPELRKREMEDTDVILLQVEPDARTRPAADDTIETRPPPMPPPGPKSASGDEMAASELADFLQEMHTLCKYGHPEQVTAEVRTLFKRFPKDLLLRRRIIDFLVEKKLVALATEELYGLGAALFEGGDVEGVRHVVTEVLRLDPHSPRAKRLMKLLAERPATSPGRR